MTDYTPQQIAERPWLRARPGTSWVITGKTDRALNLGQIIYGDPKEAKEKFSFTSCLAYVSDDSAPDEPVAFILDRAIIFAEDVTSAFEVIFVRADEPWRAAYDWDQASLDRALERRLS